MKRFEQRCELKDGEAVFRLRDYLVPGGRYPYSELAADLEEALAAGNTVYLYSVPGFMMLAGHPDGEGEPWHVTDSRDAYFERAMDALKY
jgi:hypothetical protein